MVQEWCSHLGPVEGWACKFREGWDRACVDTSAGTVQEAIDVFLEAVEIHAEAGRKILVWLMGTSVVEPPATHEAWGIL